MRILGIESSCDETAAAVVQDGRQVLSNVIATSLEEHKLYGGVVPEIASRRHAESISGVVRQALADANCDMSGIDAIAVTYAPGLIGALLVGVNFAKGLSMATNTPLVPVHHLRSHVAANYITGDLQPPFLCLVVSGGHSHIVAVEDYTTYKVLGKTRDDAAGEALDKAGRTLGLPYPGGISIDKIAPTGDENAFAFPHPRLDTPYDFSFSGLKTAVINIVHRMEQKGETLPVADLAASFQKGVTDCLVEKLEKAEQWVSRFDVSSLFMLSVLPFTPSSFMHFAFGISDFDEKRYLITMLLGKGVMVAMMALFGQSLVSSMKNPVYLVLAVVIWGAMYWGSKRFCKKHDL